MTFSMYVFWKGFSLRLGIHEKWNAWFDTTIESWPSTSSCQSLLKDIVLWHTLLAWCLTRRNTIWMAYNLYVFLMQASGFHLTWSTWTSLYLFAWVLMDVLARGGMEIHRFVPSHRTGSIWEGVNSTMNSCGICGLWWIDLFWTSVVYGRAMMCGFQRFLEACMLQEVCSEYEWRLNIHLWKTTFSGNWFLESCGTLCGDEDWREDMCNVVFVFACACSTTNSKPFSTWFYFNNFVDKMFVNVCGRFTTLHGSNWKLRFCRVRCLFQTTFAWPIFCIVFTGCFLLWNLMLQHGARQQNERAQWQLPQLAQWPVARQVTLLVFVLREKGVRARPTPRSVSRPASASCLSATPKLLEPPTTRRRRVRARNATSGCSLNFRMVAELRLTRRSEA